MPRKPEYLQDEQIEEFLSLKGKTTQRIYRGGIKLFLKYYQDKYGKDVDFNNFLNRIFDNLKKSPEHACINR
jgi:hypothetical protein